MSQQEKAAYFQALKAAGVDFQKHYREYTTEELKVAYDKLQEQQAPPPEPQGGPIPEDLGLISQVPLGGARQRAVTQEGIPVRERDPNEMAGQRLNSHADGQPIRVDAEGRTWYQEEVRKPAYPKPRGRRVLQYTETGTKTVQAKSGDYTESFEVAGDEVARMAEVKITLPSYQVGIYKDPRFPFKVVTYNSVNGFDLYDVQDYFGGAELVPQWIKRIYVENVLCYDIRSVVQEIQSQFRQLQLAGKVR